jgi:hypothetical protein
MSLVAALRRVSTAVAERFILNNLLNVVLRVARAVKGLVGQVLVGVDRYS